jgi:hypothetical protein
VYRIEELFAALVVFLSSYQFLFLKKSMQVARLGTRALSSPVGGIGKKGEWSKAGRC